MKYRRSNDPGRNYLIGRVEDGEEAAAQYKREVAKFTERENVQHRLINELNTEARQHGVGLNLRDPEDVLRLDTRKIKNTAVRDSVIEMQRRVNNLQQEKESAIDRYQRKVASAKQAEKSLVSIQANKKNALHQQRVAGHEYFTKGESRSIQLGDTVVWSNKEYTVTGKGGTTTLEITRGRERRIVPISQVVLKD